MTRKGVAALLHTTLPGLLLLSALVFAPWFWGCTWPLGIHLLSCFLLPAMAFWSVGMLLRGGRSGLPVPLLVAVLGLLGQGWWMAGNGRSVCDDETGLFIPMSGHVTWLPGSVDQDRSREDMVRLTGLLGAGILSAWLGRTLVWRRRLLWTMTATGLSIVLLGCRQRWTHATDIFWNPTRHLDYFFATYRNVTNAGEYLNLVLPIAAGLTLAAVVKRQGAFRVAFGAAATAILVTGSVISGSKMAPLATLFSAGLFYATQGKYLRAYPALGNGRTRGLTLMVAAGAVVAMVQSAGWGVTGERWNRVLHDGQGGATFSHRLLVDEACVLAVPDAGLFGLGPGTFRSIFPYYSGRVRGDLTGVWTYAHDDYAQTAVEWGVVGATLWAVYFFGGLAGLWRGWHRPGWRTEDRILAAGMLQAGVVIGMMAAVDFPLQIASIQLDVAAILGLVWSSFGWPRARPAASHSAG